MDDATTVVSEHDAATEPGDKGPRPHRTDPSMPVRSADLEPYTGLGYLSKLFKLMAAVLLLLLLSEVVTGLIAQGTTAIPTLLGEISRLLLSGHVSPVVSCFGYAEFGVIARERQYGIAIAAFHRRPRGGGDPYAAAYR